MAETMNKPNDWLVSLALNLGSGLADFNDAGLTAENTQFKDRDFYKNSKFIQDNFKLEDGSFDEAGFDNLYTQAAESYQIFGSGQYDKDLLSEIEYSYSNVFRDVNSNVRNENFDIKKISNPFKEKRGLDGIGTIKESDLSISEIAQQGKIIDFRTGKTTNLSANESGGIKGFFRDPLVLATYDEDGTHFDFETGKEVGHKAGDFKLNEFGELCYETLGDRDASQKSMLSAFDTITEDGSAMNSFDIFDADGKEQSIGKTILRGALKYAPVAIGSMAGGLFASGATVYLGTTALLNLAGALPSLYKAVEGIIPGIEDEGPRTGMWKAMNTLEGRTKSWKTGTSEYSQKHMFTWENTINMIADVGLQLGQQTTIARIPSFLKLDKAYYKGATDFNDFRNRAKKFNNASKLLAAAYMTITAGADAYGTAKQAGHTDRAAGFITLGTLAGLHKVMSSPIGEWALGKIGLDDMRIAGKPIIQDISKKWAGTFGDVPIADGKKMMKEVSRAIQKGFKKFIDNPQTLPGAMISEAVEEVSEEVVADFAMAMGAAAGAMGVTREVKWEFDIKHGFQKYTMSAFGGAIGGGIHRLTNPWSKVHNSLKEGGESQKIIEHIVKYGAKDTKSVINDLYNSGQLAGSRSFSTRYDLSNSNKGTANFLSAENEQDSQAWSIKEDLLNLVDVYDSLLNASGVGKLKDDVDRAMILLNHPIMENLKSLGLENRIAAHLNHYNNEIINIHAKMADLDQSTEEYSKLGQKLNELNLQREKILNGEHFDHYLQLGMIWLNEDVKDLFMESSKDKFSISKKGKSYDLLSESEKLEIDEAYTLYTNNSDFKLEYAVDILNYYQDKIMPEAQRYSPEYAQSRKVTFDALEQSFNLSNKLLKMIDDKGNQNTDYVEMFQRLKLEVDKVIIGQEQHITELLQNPSPEKAILIQRAGMVSVLQLIKNSGVPMDHEIKKIVDDYFNLTNQLILEKKPNISNVVTDLSQSNLIDDADYPVLKELFDFKDFKNFDKKYFLDKIDNLTESDFAESIDDLEGFVYDMETEELIEDGGDWVEYTKDLLREYVEGYEKNIQTFIGEDLKFLELFESLIKSSVTNPIYDYLAKISLLNSSDSQNIIDILKEESLKVSKSGIDNYLLSNPKMVEDTIDDIKIAKVLLGMSFNNESGESYNSVLNNFRKKSGSKLPELPMIDINDVNMMNTDLNIIQTKLEFILKLSNYNEADRLRAHKKAAANFYNKFSEIFDPETGLIFKISNDSENDFNLSEGILDLMLSPEMIDNMNALTIMLPNEINTTVNDETLKKAEVAITALEDKLHENYTKIIEKYKGNEKEFIKKIINSKFFNMNEDLNDPTTLLMTNTSDISGATKLLTDYDKLIYLCSSMFSKTSDFKYKLRNALTEMVGEGEEAIEKFKFAPLFAQEYPARIAYASMTNPEMFNIVLDCIETKDGTKLHPHLKNLVYVNGYHGTGKTSATGNLIYSLVKLTYGEDVTLSSIVERLANNLSKSINPELKGLTKDLLFTSILQGRDINEFFKAGGSYSSSDLVNLDELKTLPENLEIKKIIFIDECTWYNGKEFKLLSEWANLTGRRIVALGDDLQLGATNDVSYFNTIKSPTLEFSMRSGSSTTKDNSDTFRVLTKEINSLDDTELNRKQIVSKFEDLFSQINIKHAVDKNGLLVGSKIINKENSLEQIEGFLTDLKNKNQSLSDVGIIYESETQQNFAELKGLSNKFGAKMVKLSEMQGSEFENVILACNISKPMSPTASLIVDYCKKINTLFSRAKRGTLVITDSNDFNNTVDPSPIDLIKNSSELEKALKEFKKKRIESLDEVLKNYKAPESKLNNGTFNPSNSGNETPISGTIDELISNLVNDIITGKTSEAEESDIREKQFNRIRGRGREADDAITLAYSSYVNFGGVMTQEGNIVIPEGKDDKLPCLMDLAAFITESENGIALKIGNNTLYQNDVLNSELIREYDLFKKELLLNGLDKTWDTVTKYKDSLLGTAVNDFDWHNAEYRILYTKYSDEFDRNFEVKGEVNKKPRLMKRLILHVPSQSGGDNLGISLGFIGDKNYEGVVNDTKIKEIEDLIDKELQNKDYHELCLESEDVETTGLSTRINGGKNDKGDYKIDKSYTMKELREDLSWKNMSKPMIFTGRSSFAKTLANIENDDLLCDALDSMFKDYKLSGRPVMFISRDPRTKGWNGDQLAEYFLKQKVNLLQSELDPNVPIVEGLVSMVVLDMDSLSITDYFSQLDSAFESFKTNPDMASKYVNTISHKYMGLTMIRGIYETIDHMFANVKTFPKGGVESATLSNLVNLTKFLEACFGITSITRTINGKKEIHIAFKNKNGDKEIINPNDEKKLNKIILEIHESGTLKHDDIRTMLYSSYYGSLKTSSSKTDFNFSDIITTFMDMTKQNSGIRLAAELYNVNCNYLMSNLEYVLGGKMTVGKEGSGKEYINSVARFKNGIELHPTFIANLTGNGRGTNFVELANIDEDLCIIGHKIIDSLRFTIDYLNLESVDNKQNRVKADKQELADLKIQILKNITSNTGLDLALILKMKPIIESMKSKNDIMDIPLNNIVKNATVTLLNRGKTDTNFDVNIKFVNNQPVITKMLDLDDYKKYTSEGYKPDGSFNTSVNPVIGRFVHEDGSYRVVSIDRNGFKITTLSSKKLDAEFKQKLAQYNSDVEVFISKAIPDGATQLVMRSILTNRLPGIEEGNITFETFKQYAEMLKNNSESNYKEFIDLMDKKLELIC